eukprot:CAMPEP_0169332484 /NCGR_PEP_ID=MMETSP1017-20121227/14747_1 /TAXON_ID=342587 /ORGANISM="Karlodinium micrum, Strain CCMP2283" /LENGTH=52 /DNA_ID=CAMNT_0009427635 /DNA_START=491 /DNA_END=646 /DNA_ORIENTATION=+
MMHSDYPNSEKALEWAVTSSESPNVGMGNDIVGVPHSKLSGGPYPSPYGAAT